MAKIYTNEPQPVNVRIEDDELAVVMQDYAITRSQIQDVLTKIAQGIGLVAATLGIFATRFLDDINLPPIVAWSVPLLFKFSLLITLWLTFQEMVLEFHAMRLTEYFKKVFSKDDLHKYVLYRYDKDGILFRILSLRSGYKPFRIALLFLVTMVITLGLSIDTIAFLSIRATSPLWSNIFLVLNIILSLALVIFYYDVWYDFYKAMNTATSKYYHLDGTKSYREILNGIHKNKLFYRVFPRPTNFFGAFLIFIWGFLLTWSFFGEGIEERRPFIEIILGPLSNTPLRQQWLAVITIGIIYFFVDGFLVQMAKWLWNDIRDLNRDPLLPEMNKRRALATGSMSRIEAIIQMLVRWLLGLALAFVLDTRFFILLLIVSFLQFVYELFTKRMQRWPIIFLAIVALGIPLRFISGAIALNANIFRFELILWTALVYFHSIGNYACYRYVETHKYRREKNQPIRNLWDDFRVHGENWQRWAWCSSTICGLLLALPLLSTTFLKNTTFDTFISTIYSYLFYEVDTFAKYVLALLITCITVGIIGYLVYPYVGRALTKIIPRSTNGERSNTNKDNVLFILNTAAILLLILYFSDYSGYVQIAFAILIPIHLLFTYEAVSYNEFGGTNLVDNFTEIKKRWYHLLFIDDSRENIKNLLLWTIKINNEETAKSIESWKQEHQRNSTPNLHGDSWESNTR